jgi:YesN/AraC family two-component response regulator
MDEIQEALAAATEQLKQEAPEEDAESQNAGSFLVNRAMAYMKQHCAEKLTLQDVADACYVSQWHLSKLLNKHTESSFYDILNTVRINAARELLRDPKLKIGEIAELVGYTDTANFARVFKKLVGMNANEYRNSL